MEAIADMAAEEAGWVGAWVASLGHTATAHPPGRYLHGRRLFLG